MMVRSFCLVASLVALVAPLAAQSPVEIVRRGLDAIGGVDAVRALPGVSVTLYGTAHGIGQSELPDSPPRATITHGAIHMDFRGARRATSTEAYAVTGAVTRTRTVVAGGIGAQGQTALSAPMNAGGLANQQQSLRRWPDRLLLGALDAPTALSALPPREFRGQPHVGVRYAGADTASLYFDRATGVLTVVEFVTDDPILGDRVTQTMYSRWQSVGAGVRVPRQVDVTVNGTPWQHLIYTTASAGSPHDTLFAIPDSVAAAARAARGGPTGPAPISVALVQVAPGVWRAEGQTHHTLVVEVGADQLLLVEAPQSTQRVRAVLDTLRSRFPTRRVTTLVSTHHHWDHSGGLREIIAEGIPIVTHQANEAFVRRVGEARRTVAPDLQASRRRAPTIRTLTDSMVVGTGTGQVVVYRHPTAHAEGIVSVWVPSARVLFSSDVLNPAPTNVAPAGSWELVALARARGLSPAFYSGGHGRTVPWAEIEQAALSVSP